MLPDFSFFNEMAEAAAAQTLPRFRAAVSIDNKLSSGFDPVTAADQQAEQALRALIAERYPDHGILGEEHGGEGLDRRFVWVIDPIDGTRAFISGLPVWGTLVGLYDNGRAVMGMMDQPFTGERFIAGPQGAFLSHGGVSRPISTRACTSLETATLMTTAPDLHRGENAARYQGLERQVRLARYGCDCYAFAMVAAGHADIVVESGLKPYDVGGLITLIETAGGLITDWQGNRPEKGGDIVASGSAALHEQALLALNAPV